MAGQESTKSQLPYSWWKVVFILGLLPVLLIILPPVWRIFRTTMNLISIGHGVLTSSGLIALTVCARDQLINKSFLWSQSLILLLSFAFSLLFCVQLLGLYFTKSWVVNFLHYRPRFQYDAILWLAVWIILWGSAVIIWFIGPFSVGTWNSKQEKAVLCSFSNPLCHITVQCSSYPLVLHPLAAKWWSLVTWCSSFEGLIKLIALPSDMSTILGKTLFQAVEVQEGRRRYHYPCYPTCMTLVILSTVIGLLSLCILHPVIPMNANLAMLCVTCTSSILAHLWLYCLDGSRHEMDPVPYQDMDMTKIFSLYGTLLQKCSILVSAVIVLGVSFLSTTS